MTTATVSPTVAVVLVNWNNEEDTAECLASLAEQTYDDFCVIVVDNGSEQESLDYLTERFDWPVYVQNEENRGFTGGNNPGIRTALDMDAEWVLLLNNDTVVDEGFLTDLIAESRNLPTEAGIVTPMIQTYDSGEVWSSGAYVNGWTGRTAHRTGPMREFDGPYRVDYAVGAAMLVSAIIFRECGLLDDDFFIYYEETEFCTRARHHGWEVWFVPVTGVHHKESVEYSFNPFREYYFTRNRWLFVRKTQPLHRRVFFYPYFFLRWVLLQMTYFLVMRRNTHAARATLKGALHAVLGRTGKLED